MRGAHTLVTIVHQLFRGVRDAIKGSRKVPLLKDCLRYRLVLVTKERALHTETGAAVGDGSSIW